MESATFGNAARGAFRVFRHSDTVARKLLDREDIYGVAWFLAQTVDHLFSLDSSLG